MPCDGRNAQEDPAHRIARDRRAHRRRLHSDGPALARRRPHRAAAEDEWGRQASLDSAGGYVIADPRADAPDARPTDCAAPHRAGKPTRRGNGWTKARVCSFRRHHGIAVYRESEWAERDEITLDVAARIMDVSIMTALRMVRRGIIRGRQLCRGWPGGFGRTNLLHLWSGGAS